MKMKDYLTPSGLTFTLRELTGEDDDVINGSAKDESQVINNYVANAIAKGPDGHTWTPEKVKGLKLRDKYFLLVASRILNLGPNLIFEFKWPGMKEATEYTEDLNQFVWDYNEPFPGKDSPLYFSERLDPYPENMDFMTVQTSKFEVRIDFLDGKGEEYLLNLKDSEKTMNSQLRARNISFREGDIWSPIKNFASFSQMDMVKLRAIVQEFDVQSDGLMDIENPMDGSTHQVPLLSVKDFFYPVKV